jgi:hypothetical protein
MKKFYYFVFILFFGACSITTDESSSYGTGDGSATSPVELTVGTAKAGNFAKYGYSYYKFTTSSTGAGSYKLAISSLSITDSYSSSSSIISYLYTVQGTPSNYLTYQSCADSCYDYFWYKNMDESTTYYIRIYGYGKGTYSLTLSQGGSEGSESNPVALTLSTAHTSGTIDNVYPYPNYGYRYYKFTTSSADNYTLSMNNSDSLDCSLYSDSGFSTYVTSYSYGHCTAGTNLYKNFTGTTSSGGLSASTVYYLKIWGSSSTAKTTTYDNMTVAPEG